MWETVGQVIFNGGIERLAGAAADVYGAALTSNLRRLTNQFYPNLRASSTEALVRYAYDAIGSARGFQNGADGYTSALGNLPNTYSSVGYNFPTGYLESQGYQQGFTYSFNIHTRNRDTVSGVVTERVNRVNVFSNTQLTRQQALNRAQQASLEYINFRQGTNNRNQQTFIGNSFNAVYRGWGTDE